MSTTVTRTEVTQALGTLGTAVGQTAVGAAVSTSKVLGKQAGALTKTAGSGLSSATGKAVAQAREARANARAKAAEARKVGAAAKEQAKQDAKQRAAAARAEAKARANKAKKDAKARADKARKDARALAGDAAERIEAARGRSKGALVMLAEHAQDLMPGIERAEKPAKKRGRKILIGGLAVGGAGAAVYWYRGRQATPGLIDDETEHPHIRTWLPTEPPLTDAELESVAKPNLSKPAEKIPAPEAAPVPVPIEQTAVDAALASETAQDEAEVATSKDEDA